MASGVRMKQTKEQTWWAQEMSRQQHRAGEEFQSFRGSVRRAPPSPSYPHPTPSRATEQDQGASPSPWLCDFILTLGCHNPRDAVLGCDPSGR